MQEWPHFWAVPWCAGATRSGSGPADRSSHGAGACLGNGPDECAKAAQRVDRRGAQCRRARMAAVFHAAGPAVTQIPQLPTP